jgi:hypothetical protein
MSLRVIMRNKQLLLFPVISGVFIIAILASFVGAMFLSGTLLAPNIDVLFIVFWVVFYFVAFFISIFFNVALVSCAMKELDGERTTVSYGISQAMGRLRPILGWALLSATIGLILKAIQERAGVIGRIVIGFIGAGWAIATYFVVPVIAFEGLGPFASIKRSLGLLKGTWGEAAVSNIGIGLIFGLAALAGLVPVILAFVMAGVTVGLVVLLVVIVYWIVLGVLASAASGVLLASLYRFATTGKVTEGFPEQILRNPGSP